MEKPSVYARAADGRLETWVCTSCGRLYDPVEGDPATDTAPGVPFEALGADWRCPNCGADKDYFIT